MTTWVLSTDRYRARCFDYDARHSSLNEVHDLLNPVARQTIENDHGRRFDGGGGTRRSREPRITPHEQEHGRFARDIADFLASEQAAGHFDQLQLVAASDWLAELRTRLPDSVRRTLTEPLQKNLAKAPDAELLQQLKNHAWH